MKPTEMLTGTQFVQAMAGKLKEKAKPFEPVPHANVPAMIGRAILGLCVALLGLAVMALGGYGVVQAKGQVSLFHMILLGAGLALVFVGGNLISAKLLASLRNVVTVGQAIGAGVKATWKAGAP